MGTIQVKIAGPELKISTLLSSFIANTSGFISNCYSVINLQITGDGSMN